MKTFKIVAITTAALLGLIIFINVGAFFNRSKSASDRIQPHNAVIETVAANDAFDYYDEVSCAEEMDFEPENLNGEGFLNNTSDPTNLSYDSRMLIRTVNTTMETTAFENVISTIQTNTKNLGGYFEISDISGTGNNNSYRHAYLIIRVPSDKLDELTASIAGIATVTASSESCEDVTINYIDTQARIDSLRVEQETLNGLLANATDLDTIIVLQNELTSVRYEIETYERQLRYLSDQVTYATLNITINEVIEETPIVEIEEVREQTFGEKIKESFNDSIKDLKEDMKLNTIAFVGILPQLVLLLVQFAIIVLVITLVVKLIIKITKKKINKKKATIAEVKKETETLTTTQNTETKE